MDTSSLMEQILSSDNLNRAYLQVVRNKGAEGVDGMKYTELKEYLAKNGEIIKEQLRKRKYKPQPVQRVEIPKSQLSLYDLAKVILDIPAFDVRLAAGDPELVNIIAKNVGAINMFSFASKYCTYHNVEVYHRDDYSIFDAIVKESLPNYVDGLSKHKLDVRRSEYNYVAFNECIGGLLDEYNIHIPFRRRKFDHFLWYANR